MLVDFTFPQFKDATFIFSIFTHPLFLFAHLFYFNIFCKPLF